MTDRPLDIFIASASEGLEVANAIRDELARFSSFKPRVWSDRTFKPSMTFIEAVEAELIQCDFAVLTLTPDDLIESRGQMSMAPRDNVLLELGLFMGRLGRQRTYFVCDKTQSLKIPTDLLEVNPATYEMGVGQSIQAALVSVCSSLASRMIEVGSRPKQTPEEEMQSRMVTQFCQRISGS